MNSTPFADACWNVAMYWKKLETLDFLSEDAAKSIAFAAAKEMEEFINPEISEDELMAYSFVAGGAANSHALGAILSAEWQDRFGREFTKAVKDRLIQRREREKNV